MRLKPKSRALLRRWYRWAAELEAERKRLAHFLLRPLGDVGLIILIDDFSFARKIAEFETLPFEKRVDLDEQISNGLGAWLEGHPEPPPGLDLLDFRHTIEKCVEAEWYGRTDTPSDLSKNNNFNIFIADRITKVGELVPDLGFEVEAAGKTRRLDFPRAALLVLQGLIADLGGDATLRSIGASSSDSEQSLADELNIEGKPTRACLVQLLMGRSSSDYEEIADKVHGNGSVSGGAIEKGAREVSDFAAEHGYRLSYVASGGKIFKRLSPE